MDALRVRQVVIEMSTVDFAVCTEVFSYVFESVIKAVQSYVL